MAAEDVDRPRDLSPSPDYGLLPLRSPPPLLRKRDRSRSRSRSPVPQEERSGGARDTEYRGRSSLSPSPPYGHRDRRYYSQPRMSPPPGSSKRSRREDGGYCRRPGRPRGAYGSEGRRYGYDYGGGHERGGTGNRGGYGDESNCGRYMDRPSGKG